MAYSAVGPGGLILHLLADHWRLVSGRQWVLQAVRLNRDRLDRVEHDLVAGLLVELGGARPWRRAGTKRRESHMATRTAHRHVNRRTPRLLTSMIALPVLALLAVLPAAAQGQN